jgi:hypothetical protein
MKLIIISNKNGKIIGTSLPAKAVKGGPKMGGLLPHEGQRLHEIDVDERLVTMDAIRKLHSTHLVELIGEKAQLVKYKDS